MAHEPVMVVVGAGVAGWTAARRTQEAGLRVVLLERTDGPTGGNGLYSGGNFHAAYAHPSTAPDELYRRMMTKTDGQARPDVARAWADNVGRAAEFLGSQGVPFGRAGDAPHRWNVVMPPNGAGQDPLGSGYWRDRGPDRLFAALHRQFVAAGGTFLARHRAVRLLVENGRVAGVRAEAPGGAVEVRGEAVLLADGGFQASPELVRRHITSDYQLRAAGTGTGDALAMAVEAGAATTDLHAFYGHVLVRDALHNPRLWPAPSPFIVIACSIVVDAGGRRIVDEWWGEETYSPIDDSVAAAIAASASPGGCWSIFDSRTWETVGRHGTIPLNPTLLDEGGTMLSAETLEELAALARLPVGELAATVDSFNRFCLDGTPVEPPRTGGPLAIDRPPYHAVPLIAGITFTMGGILVNGRAQALDADGRPIPGLYAAGGAMGGLQGGPRHGYSGGWAEAATFGMLAAEDAARAGRP